MPTVAVSSSSEIVVVPVVISISPSTESVASKYSARSTVLKSVPTGIIMSFALTEGAWLSCTSFDARSASMLLI